VQPELHGEQEPLASQILVVFILMFSPLNFPADRLPGWLAAIHGVLPIQAMGEVMRGTIASNSFPLTWGAFLLLGTWCVASFTTRSLVLTRRGVSLRGRATRRPVLYGIVEIRHGLDMSWGIGDG